MWSALRRGPQRLTCPVLENVHLFFRGSEIPVVHLQLFQVCYEAKDSTVILRLAALETGDRGDRTK